MENIFDNVSCGVYIASSGKSGCIINTLTQINSKDPLVMISLHKDNYTNKVIKDNKKFAVSILNVDTTMEEIALFGFKSSKDVNKFESVSFEEINGINIVIDNVLGYIVCDLKEIIDCDTHDIFIGIVKNQKIINDSVPMTYDYYKKIKKGSTPLKAPSFFESKEEIQETNEKKYQCIICGHIYDDAIENINFEDLPENWVCPKCRVGKDKFKRIK